MGSSVRHYCTNDRKCSLKCSNGIREGDPESVSCKDGSWNALPRTKIYCNSAKIQPPKKVPPKTPLFPKEPETRPFLSSFSNLIIAEGTPDVVKEASGLAFGPLTDCGPVLEHFSFPKGSLARCSNNLCKVECSAGRIPKPKIIKCIKKTSKFWPRPNSEISCSSPNKAPHKFPSKKPAKRPLPAKIPSKLEKPSPCGTIENSEITLGEGVGAICNPFGCQFRCETGSPNMKSVRCFMRKKRFVPKKEKIFCQP
ncbi:Oidioi.mRNA.OKI2018_I69.PAR.g8481.t1.cds [Oikopleura dioica]|uniref:Oidioi.mRNA.OKI2018_I69.PAR.g8481.t1.cds n=1 Tax=Oikopleura dioica TaxID=34765 RepID=A0ABN7RLK9_OIKDI|nr:Oidioi.mRNA.OKI2018_I69.PAR.g8481.t1.cds [Oikopleura dioica]